MPWYANQTSTTFISKIDRLNRFYQSLLPNFFGVKTFLEARIVHINLATCAAIQLFCDSMWDGQLNHIGICIWVRILLPPSHASLQPPFLHQSPSKNEVPPVLIHPHKSTQHRPSQQSIHISPVLEIYVG